MTTSRDVFGVIRGSWATRLLAISLLLCAAKASGEDSVEFRVPPKDVLVLVDVSGSMAVPGTGGKPIPEMKEAREIIIGIVEGRGMGRESGGWILKDKSVDDTIRKGFSGYLDSQERLPPLIERGKSLSVKLVGNFNTVLKNSLQKGKGGKREDYLENRKIPDYVQLENDGFREVLEGNWPDRFQDQSTCYTFALARAAKGMGVVKDGYYIFTVSDEEDDPSYRPKSEEAKLDRDQWKDWWVGKGWPLDVIDATIAEGMKALSPSVEGNWQSIRSKQLIARFEKKRADGRGKVKINWYFGGAGPEAILKEVSLAPKVEGLPEVEQAKLKFRLLGTAGGDGKGAVVFDYRNAMLVYQIDHLSGRPPAVKASVNDIVVPPVQTTRRAQGPGTVGTLGLGELFEANQLKYGETYTLKLSAADVEPVEIAFRVDPPSLRWLYYLGWGSAALAVGIFVYSWITLRGAEQV